MVHRHLSLYISLCALTTRFPKENVDVFLFKSIIFLCELIMSLYKQMYLLFTTLLHTLLLPGRPFALLFHIFVIK